MIEADEGIHKFCKFLRTEVCKFLRTEVCIGSVPKC